MATATVTPNQDVVLAEIFIAAPPERVFQAITDPAQMPQWWGQQGFYRITEWKNDLRRGGKWSSAGVGADGTKFSVDGEYLEVDPPRRLVHTWNPSYGGPQGTEPWSNCVMKASAACHKPPSATAKAGNGSSAGWRHSSSAAKPSIPGSDGRNYVVEPRFGAESHTQGQGTGFSSGCPNVTSLATLGWGL